MVGTLWLVCLFSRVRSFHIDFRDISPDEGSAAAMWDCPAPPCALRPEVGVLNALSYIIVFVCDYHITRYQGFQLVGRFGE